MASETKAEVRETGTKLSKMERFKIRFKSFFRGTMERGNSSETVPALSPQLDPKTTPPAKEDSRNRISETDLVQKPEPIPEADLVHKPGPTIEPGGHECGHDNSNDESGPETDSGDIVSQDQDSSHQDDGSQFETSSSLAPATPRDLWAEAWAELSDTTKDQLASWNEPPIDSSNESSKVFKTDNRIKSKDQPVDKGQTWNSMANKSDYVQEVIHGTTKRLKAYQNRWGSQLKPTSLGKAKSVLVSALTIRQLIDAGLKFDPSGYASCAWAVVSFGLTLVDNDKKRMDLAFDASADCADLLARYCKIESYFRRITPKDENQGTENLENALVEAYVAIFEYSANVKQAVDGSHMNRVKESFKALTGQPLEALKTTVLERDSIVRTWEDLVNREYEAQFREDTKMSLENLGEDAAKILEKLGWLQIGTADIKHNVDVLVEDAVLNWLSPMDTQSARIHQGLRDSIHKVTTEEEHWFLQDQQYLDWKAYPQSVLWLHAPAGCGKSSLCSTVIQDLAAVRDSEKPRQKVLVYWYFQSNKMETLDLKLVLRAFLRGLLASSPKNALLKDVNNWLVEVRHQEPPPDKETLLKKVKHVIERLQRDVFIVLDGLDGFPRESKGIERGGVLDLVSDLVKDKDTNLKLHLLMVSTFENDIRVRLEDDADLKLIINTVSIEEGLRGELDDFIDRTMDNDKDFSNLEANLKSEVTRSLKGGEGKYGTRPDHDRNFRWVTSLLDDLRACGHNEKEIKKQLKRVPNSMAEKYEQALNDIKKKNQPTMKLVLIWMLRHKRDEKPLKVEELAEAVSKDSEELSKMLPGSLIRRHEKPSKLTGDDETDNDDSLPYFEFDFSAKEHLEARCDETQKLFDGEAGAAAASWFIFSDQEAHRQMATRCLKVLTGSDSGSPSRESPLMKYAAQYWHEHYLDYVKMERPEEKSEVSKLEKLVAKLFTAGTAFRSWLDTWNPDNDFEPSPEFDLEETDDDGDDDDDDGDGDGDGENDDGGENENGGENGGGGDDDDDDDDDDKDDSNSESQSSGDGDSDMTNISLGHPVYYAVKLKLLRMAIKMIEKAGTGGRPCAQPGKEGTALQLALYYEHWEVADALLRHCDPSETTVAIRRYPHGTPLYIASAKAGNEKAVEIVKTLIFKGARVDGVRHGKQNGKYGSALHAAAYFGHIAAVRLLLGVGKADFEKQEGMFGTALHAAAANGHHEIVELLLKDGASPTIISGLFGSALQVALAAGSNSQNTVDILRQALQTRGVECDNFSGIGWETAFDQLKDSQPRILRQFELLFKSRMPTDHEFQMPNPNDVWRQQTLLAGVFKSWELPAVRSLSTLQNRLADHLPYRAPVQEQLNAIQSVLPDFTKCCGEHELNRLDFRYKALFWSGINYILENLDLLVERSIESMQDSLARTIDFQRFPDWYYRYLVDLDSSHGERDYWYRERLGRHFKLKHFNVRSRMRWFERSIYPRYSPDYGLNEMAMDFSDKVALEMAQQQQKIQRRLSREGQKDGMAKAQDRDKMRLGSITSTDAHWRDHDGDGDDDDGQNDMEIHLVVDNLLPLMKHIVDFGKQCDRLHSMTARGDSADTVKSLTFEVFAALVRLTISINRWRTKVNMGWDESAAADSLLGETVHLLKTVRLPRITRLAVAASQQLTDVHNEEKSGEKNDFIAGPKMGASSSSGNDRNPPLLQDIPTTTLHELPALVRAEMMPVLKQLREDTYVNMRQLVQDAIRDELQDRHRAEEQAAEVSSLPPERKGWPSRWGVWSRN